MKRNKALLITMLALAWSTVIFAGNHNFGSYPSCSSSPGGICVGTNTMPSMYTTYQEKTNPNDYFIKTNYAAHPYDSAKLNSYVYQRKSSSASLKSYMSGIFNTVPQGFMLIGEFDPNKPTAIFIHGWVPPETDSTVTLVEGFVNQVGWNSAGYNTFIYRWHRDAYDDSICNFSGLTLECPPIAEKRIWGDNVHVGEDFVRGYKAFFDNIAPNYSKEVQVIGHSLGVQMAVYLTYKLHKENYSIKPQRLVTIEPWISGNIPDDHTFPIPPNQTAFGDSLCSGDKYKTEIACIVRNAIYDLDKNYGVGNLIYGGIVAWTNSFQGNASVFDLGEHVNFVESRNSWLCSKSWWGNYSDCGWVWNLNIFYTQHWAPKEAYMWSINETMASTRAMPATYPTASLRASHKWVWQSDHMNYCNIRGSARNLMDVQSGTWGRSLTKQQFINDLVYRQGYSFYDASQCAAAVSLSNDLYSYIYY